MDVDISEEEQLQSEMRGEGEEEGGSVFMIDRKKEEDETSREVTLSSPITDRAGPADCEDTDMPTCTERRADRADAAATAAASLVEEETVAKATVAPVSGGDVAARFCKVCDSPQAAGMYFGVLACIPCKAFFIRCLTDLENGLSMGCVSRDRPDQCDITLETRTVCKACRFQKCLRQGMARKERPASISNEEGRQLCAVCSDIANGIHFGAVTCEGCKKFYRRAMNEAHTYTCKHREQCDITARTRNSCRFCRWHKCLRVGMSKQAIRMGRPSKFAQLQLPYKEPVVSTPAPPGGKEKGEVPHSLPASGHSVNCKDRPLVQQSSSGKTSPPDTATAQVASRPDHESAKPSSFQPIAGHQNKTHDLSKQDRTSKNSKVCSSSDSSNVLLKQSNDRRDRSFDTKSDKMPSNYSRESSQERTSERSAKLPGFYGNADRSHDDTRPAPTFHQGHDPVKCEPQSQPGPSGTQHGEISERTPSYTAQTGHLPDRPYSSGVKDSNPTRDHQMSKYGIMDSFKGPDIGQMSSDATVRGHHGNRQPSGTFSMPLDLVHHNTVPRPPPQAQTTSGPTPNMPHIKSFMSGRHKQMAGLESANRKLDPWIAPNQHSSSVIATHPRYSRSLSDPRSSRSLSDPRSEGTSRSSLDQITKQNVRPQWFTEQDGVNRSMSTEEPVKTTHLMGQNPRWHSNKTNTLPPAMSLPLKMDNRELLETIIKEEIPSGCQFGDMSDSASKASVSPTELISGEASKTDDDDDDDDLFEIGMEGFENMFGLVDDTTIKTEPDTDEGYGGNMCLQEDAFDPSNRKRKIAHNNYSPTEENKGLNTANPSLYTGNGSTSRKVQNIIGQSQVDPSQQSNVSESFVAAFLNFIKVIQELPATTDVSQKNARDLLTSVCGRSSSQGQPGNNSFSNSQLEDIQKALSALIPSSSSATSAAGGHQGNVAYSSSAAYATSGNTGGCRAGSTVLGSAGASNKAFTQWRSPTAALPQTRPQVSRSFLGTDSSGQPGNQTSFAASSQRQDARFPSSVYTTSSPSSTGSSSSSSNYSPFDGGPQTSGSKTDIMPDMGDDWAQTSMPSMVSSGDRTSYSSTPSQGHCKDRDYQVHKGQTYTSQAQYSPRQETSRMTTAETSYQGVSNLSNIQTEQQQSAERSVRPSEQSTQPSNPGDAISFIIQTMMENLTAGFKTAKQEADKDTNSRPQSGPSSTISNPQGLPTMPPPKGLPTMPSPKGLPTMPPPQGLPGMSPPQRLPTMPALQGLPTMSPPQGLPTMSAPSGLPRMQQPQGLPGMARPEGLPTMPLPQELATMPPGISAATNFPHTAPPFDMGSFPPNVQPPVPSDGDLTNQQGQSQVPGPSASPAMNMIDLPPWEPPKIDFDYWLNPKLPSPNVFLSDDHLEYINNLLSAYKDYIEDMEGTLLYLQTETRKFLKKFGEVVPPLEILRKELALFAQSTVSFCCRIPEFSQLCKEDQMVLYRVGGNQSRILTSAVHWFDKEAREYTIFYPLKPHPGRMDYQFYSECKQFCQHVQDHVEVDLVEESLLQAVLLYATDYQGLKDPELLSKLRWHALECFRAYTTAKYGSSNRKMEDLFSIIPQLRQLGLLEHQLGQNLSLLKDQSYPIPDPTSLKQDFPLPDLVHDVIMPTTPRRGDTEQGDSNG